MTKELIYGVIALWSIIIPALVSYFISKLSTNNEIRKIRLEASKTYEEKILESRIASYPLLYYILSNMGKEIRKSHNTKEFLNDSLSQIGDWDSLNAIFLSAETTSTCFEFREYFRNSIDNIANAPVSSEIVDDFLNKIGNFEYALKKDLGIWGIEGISEFRMIKIKSYKDILTKNEE